MDQPPKILDYATPRPVPRLPILRLAWGMISALSLIIFGVMLASLIMNEFAFSRRHNVDPMSLWAVALYLLTSACMVVAGIARMIATIRNVRRIPLDK